VCSRSRSDAASDLIVRAADVEALAQARHGDPFAVLGMHESDGALAVRAMLPGASAVDVVDAASGRVVATLAPLHGAGVFGGRIPRRRKRFAYRLRVTWPGAIVDIEDPYRFAPLLGELDLWLFAEGTHTRLHDKLGAHRRVVEGVDGVSFAVWAPNATRVAVIGDFNAWDGRRHGMRLRRECGVWEIFLPGVADGARYKFEIKGPLGELLPAKADPFAFATELRPATASVVGPIPSPTGDAARPPALTPDAPVAIYEVHAGSWRRGPGGRFLGWHELADALLPYVLELGFTHVEFLPIMEHPFDGSWGYQPTGLYAPTARHGTPADFAALVARFHAAGVGVILDWVPGHFPSDAHGLAAFDGSHLYEHADPRQGLHRDWNTLIYNYGRPEVRNFLTANALFWLGRYGVAGLRVDAVASMLYLDYSRPPGAWIPNVHGGRENLEAIALLKRTNEVVGIECPGAFTVAEESTAFPGVSAPTYAGGLGFHFKWNMGWMHDTLEYMRQDPVHRRWHHDEMTFGLVYAFSENFVLPLSHDEVVHGKGSILGRMPGDEWQRFANLRAYYGFMWGHPGKKLLFMGQEFAQGTEWNHDAELPWWLLQHERHAGVQRLVRDLNRLYREQPALHRLDGEGAGFEWIDAHDGDRSLLSWVRRDGQGGQVIVVSNMTPVPRTGLRLGVPEGAGAWREVINTDSAFYGGGNLGNGAGPLAVQAVASHGRGQSIELTVPPLATVFLVPA
jgi:1,4-alpha-glucan branching enzyme